MSAHSGHKRAAVGTQQRLHDAFALPQPQPQPQLLQGRDYHTPHVARSATVRNPRQSSETARFSRSDINQSDVLYAKPDAGCDWPVTIFSHTTSRSWPTGDWSSTTGKPQHESGCVNGTWLGRASSAVRVDRGRRAAEWKRRRRRRPAAACCPGRRSRTGLGPSGRRRPRADVPVSSIPVHRRPSPRLLPRRLRCCCCCRRRDLSPSSPVLRASSAVAAHLRHCTNMAISLLLRELRKLGFVVTRYTNTQWNTT